MRRAPSRSKTPATKKSGRQLDREIAQALGRKEPSRKRTSSPGASSPHASRLKGHARVKTKSDGNGADVLLVANDAALGTQYDRAEKLLAQTPQRTISTAFTTVTPESAEAGDYASRGWDNEDGDAIEVDANDFEEAVDAGSHAPVTDAIVKKVVRWLRDQGATETSASSFHRGVWYETEFAMDYGSGEEKQEEFFLRNFTEDEERRVFKEFHGGRRQ